MPEPAMTRGRGRATASSLGALVALALLGLVVWQIIQLLDPNRPVRELALRDARAGAQLDYAQLWRDHSGCWQRRHPEAEWARSQGLGLADQPEKAPADTEYTVVGVETDGAYKRAEVRVSAPGYQQLDYEIDAGEYGGRWVMVDRGDLGHQIADDCTGGWGR